MFFIRLKLIINKGRVCYHRQNTSLNDLGPISILSDNVEFFSSIFIRFQLQQNVSRPTDVHNINESDISFANEWVNGSNQYETDPDARKEP